MSDGKRFWGRRAIGNNRVVTRERGDIPGCLPACDIHLNISVEEMRAATAERVKGFQRIMGYWMSGRDDRGYEYGHREFMNDKFHRTDAKISAIGNPSKPYGRDW